MEVDLDKNLITPIPEGMDKNELAVIIANYFGYKSKITKTKVFDFNGLKTDFDAIFKGKVKGEDYWILAIEITGDNVVAKYQMQVEEDSKYTAIEYGILKYAHQGGELLKKIFKKIEQDKINSQVNYLENQVLVLKTEANSNADAINTALNSITPI